MRDEIVRHARDEFPRECCGLIAGKDGTPTRLYRMTNVEEGNRLYRVDDDELYQLTKELYDRDEVEFAIYHSHPSSPAYPSKTDVELAFWQDAYYLICSLEEPDSPYLRAFRIVDSQISEAEIEVVET
jgi:[CysO sulfur-carrier protein]-S-L-cysteine hydrolase